ncbi:GAP family protein [Microbacterium sp. NEAU-LLC]|uniref:GAP family protein n=1 Tax=Microbacterium helvum TaxID=2773713 RepID=A0ABR8NT23_9MICO|nr:GAP family protein [Microbacterium helvum]MBD3943779.1 GAP family protein [Microbacterium helvum]
MGDLIVQLIPPLLGVILSPLAIMALVAVLLSRLARVNGIAFLLGWAVGIVGVLALSMWIFSALQIRALHEPPLWVAIVRLLLGLLLVGGAWYVYHRGAERIARMAAAEGPKAVAHAAKLPGWLQSVSTFKPGRTFLLGVGLFVINPVDASCAIIAGLDIVLADVSTTEAFWVAFGFAVLGVLPIAIPVVWVVVAGERAQPSLDRMRTWIAGNTHVLNAALLLVIGALQLEKAITAMV